MYKIVTPTGESILAEKVNYIRVHRSGNTFILTDFEHADGVAYHSTPYLFKDGAHVSEFDAADELRRLESENTSLKSQLAAAEDALCEIDSANEERIAAIEDALCEIDMGGMN